MKKLLLPLGLVTLLALFFVLREGNSVHEPVASEFSSKRAMWEHQRVADPATGTIPEGIREAELRYAATLPSREARFAAKGNRAALASWEHRGPGNVGGRTRALALDVTGEDTILAGGATGGVWRSSDGGASWIKTTTSEQAHAISSIVQDTRPGREATWYFGTGEFFSSGSGINRGGARFAGGGLYKSTDNGRSWRGLESTNTGSPHIFNLGDLIWRVALDPSNLEEDEVYMAIRGGVERSTDGGESWTSAIKSSGLQPSEETDVAVTDQGVVYAVLSSEGRSRGIYRSEDGITFANILPENFSPSYGRIVIGIDPTNQNRVYFLGETSGAGAEGKDLLGDAVWHSLWVYTWVSGDGTGEGGLWEDRSANLPLFGGSFGDFNSQGGYDLAVAVKPDDENVVVIGGTNLYRSTDAFRSAEKTDWVGGYRDEVWKLEDNRLIIEYEYPNHHPDVHTILFSRNDPSIMFTGSDGGVHRTSNALKQDSIDWVSLNNHYLTTQFYSIGVDRETPGSEKIAGGLQDNGTWRNNGKSGDEPWIFSGSGDGAHVAYADGGRLLYAAKQSGRLYRIELDEEGEMTGSTRLDPAGRNFDNFLFINPFRLDPSDRKVLYTPYANIVMVNSDVTAIPLGNDKPTPIGWDSIIVGSNTFITALGVSEQSPTSRLWCGDALGGVYRVDDAASGNPTSTNVTGNSFPGRAWVSCIAVDPRDGNHAIVVFSSYRVRSLFRTTNGGATWESISGNLEEEPDGSGSGPSCRWVSIVHRGKGTLYLVGTSVGLFSTSNLNGDDTVWEQEGESTIGNAIVDMIDARSSDGFVAIGTHGAGVFSATLAELGVERSERTSNSLTLSSIAPNPLTDEGTFSWSFSGARSQVRLDLIDMRGRVVAELRNEEMPSGEYSEQIEGSDLPSGLYLLRLEVNGERLVRRVLVQSE